MNEPDSTSLDTWHMIVNCFAWGGPSSPITLYSGIWISCVMHSSCNAPTALSCSMSLYGEGMSGICITSSGPGSCVDEFSSWFSLFRIHVAASCLASFLERPLPTAGKYSHINVKHYLCCKLQYFQYEYAHCFMTETLT